MPPIIECEECGKNVEQKSNRQTLCPECRPKVYRRRATECERRRRKELGETYRAYDRANRNKPDNLEKDRQRSRNYYHKMKNNPVYMAKVKDRHKVSMDNWLNKRDFGGNWYKVYHRDGGKCQVCGSTENPVVHHKDRKGWGFKSEEKNNSMDNLILLCDSCHAKIHELGIKGDKICDSNS
jgi:5-methylcytosine-specific restriction endonuclease McrA